MSEWQRGDEPVGRSRGATCLATGLLGIGAVFVGILILVALGSVLSRPGPPEVTPASHPAVGLRLAEMEVDLDPLTGTDESVTPESLRGKVVLLNFWGTWCQPCWEELPHVAKLEAELRHRPDFKLLAVSCAGPIPEDTDSLRHETRTFLEGFDLDMPTYADPNGDTRMSFFAPSGSIAYPSTFVLDRQGVIRSVWSGFRPDVPEQIERKVHQLLEEPDLSGGEGVRR